MPFHNPTSTLQVKASPLSSSTSPATPTSSTLTTGNQLAAAAAAAHGYNTHVSSYGHASSHVTNPTHHHQASYYHPAASHLGMDLSYFGNQQANLNSHELYHNY